MSGQNELDCTNASRGVWLVKVPKYISSKWQKAAPMTEVGRLKISKYCLIESIETNLFELTMFECPSRGANGKPEILFNLSDKLSKSDSPNEPNKEKSVIPTEHQFAISDIKYQSLAVFSQFPGNFNIITQSNRSL